MRTKNKGLELPEMVVVIGLMALIFGIFIYFTPTPPDPNAWINEKTTIKKQMTENVVTEGLEGKQAKLKTVTKEVRVNKTKKVYPGEAVLSFYVEDNRSVSRVIYCGENDVYFLFHYHGYIGGNSYSNIPIMIVKRSNHINEQFRYSVAKFPECKTLFKLFRLQDENRVNCLGVQKIDPKKKTKSK